MLFRSGVGIDENTAIILDKNGNMEVFGGGSVTVVDGSQITYNEIAEVDDFQSFSVFGVQLHVMQDGLIYDYLQRRPIPPPNEYLIPDLA